jgi:NTP pyrophosphatase (non-canonical NTP hydrolase)
MVNLNIIDFTLFPERTLLQIQEFQDMMKRLYFDKDNKRGAKGTFEWLTDEVKELGEELDKGDLKSAGKEFADVLAWVASLANIVGISLETEALSKYPNTCPRCQQSPCQCPFS